MNFSSKIKYKQELFVLILSVLFTNSTAFSKSVSFYELKSGLGSYRDLQVPIWGDIYRGNGQIRADGTSAVNDNGFHLGIPVEGSMTYRWYRKNISVDSNIKFTLIKHLIGDEDASSSSFQRIAASITPGMKYKYKGLPVKAGLKFSASRIDYLNLSTGHTLTGLLAGPTVQIGSLRKVRIEAEYKRNILPSFSFRNIGNYLNLDAIDDSDISHNIYKVEASRLFKNSVIGLLGYEQDKAEVNLTNRYKYNDFGLNVSSMEPQSKTYILDTHIVTFGLRKVF